MKPYTFPICKMLGYTDSPQSTPLAANGEAGPLESPLLAASPNLNCFMCKRTLLVGELYADGYRDNPILCHHCQAEIDANIAAEPIFDPPDLMDDGGFL